MQEGDGSRRGLEWRVVEFHPEGFHLLGIRDLGIHDVGYRRSWVFRPYTVLLV